MVVVTIMVILISMAIPQLTRSITRSKESVLRNNLFTLRTVIDNYSYDKGKAPQSLQDLVTEGYLRALPTDPMNNYSTDWRTVMEDASQSVEPAGARHLGRPQRFGQDQPGRDSLRRLVTAACGCVNGFGTCGGNRSLTVP
jgi:type II secretory pathway pseudopilin PulG